MAKSQKVNLLDAMRSSAKGAAATPQSAAAVAEPPASAAAQGAPTSPHFRPGRSNKSNVTGYFPMSVKRQLRMMSAEQDKTIQRLLAEALNDLFAKHGKPEIAPLEE